MSELPIAQKEIDRLRALGFVIMPLKPSDDMLKVGAPSCFQAYDGEWEVALMDAAECYRAMVEVGCL